MHRAILAPALALFILCLSVDAAAQECATCWNDSCKEMQAYLPRCEAAATPTPKPKGKPHPTPSAARCPAGQVENADTDGHCCWPGQAWAHDKCIGIPTQCPEGTLPVEKTQSCEPVACTGGQERAQDGKHCCWPGQAWSSVRNACVGIPAKCPAGMGPAGENCVKTAAAPTPTPAPAVSAGPAATAAPGRITLEMLRVPAGAFAMGCATGDGDCVSNEKPVRVETLPSFQVARNLVTVAAYHRCVLAGACTPPGAGEKCNGEPHRDHPANCVDWSQATAFCAWAGGRLPTATEWEYAAKAGEDHIYPWGNAAPDPTRASYGAEETSPVGTHPAGDNRWGLHDMAGNVWEWTSTSNKGGVEIRGGAWDATALDLRASDRGRSDPGNKSDGIGLRCVQ